jgi:hypothetical protein
MPWNLSQKRGEETAILRRREFMADTPHGEPVRIIGEERLHPALRKLGRACIALARWQRQQQPPPTAPAPDEAVSGTDPGDQPATEILTVSDQEARHD